MLPCCHAAMLQCCNAAMHVCAPNSLWRIPTHARSRAGVSTDVRLRGRRATLSLLAQLGAGDPLPLLQHGCHSSWRLKHGCNSSWLAAAVGCSITAATVCCNCSWMRQCIGTAATLLLRVYVCCDIIAAAAAAVGEHWLASAVTGSAAPRPVQLKFKLE